MSGTTLIAMHNDDAIVLAVDSLGHSQDRLTVANKGHFKKFHIIDEKFVVGTVGMIECAEIEYKFENWVSDWVESQFRLLAAKTTNRIAGSLYKEMRKSIHPIERLPNCKLWQFDPRIHVWPVDVLVTFVMCGYDSGIPKLLKFGADIDRKRRHILDTPVFELNSPAILGNRESLMKIDSPGLERTEYLRIRAEIEAFCETLPADSHEIVINAVAAIKVEAYFNSQRVGGPVNAVVIERESGKATSLTF